MKRLIVFVFVAMFLSGCVENIRSDRELYGNTFINIGGEEFEVPDDWVLYNLMDSACSIMMPTYMTETFLDGVDIIDVGTKVLPLFIGVLHRDFDVNPIDAAAHMNDMGMLDLSVAV